MKIHIVQKGDTIWDIAQKYGVDFEQVKDLNPQISSPDMIMPGMKIKIPSTTKQVKKEGVHPKETQQQPPKEQQIVPSKPIQIIPEDDQKQPKEVKMKKPPIKEMPKMPEIPKEPEYPKKEMPKMPMQPEKEKSQIPEKPMKEMPKMPAQPMLEMPMSTTPKKMQIPSDQKPKEEKKQEHAEYMPPQPMPMVPMMPHCCQFIPTCQQCCHQMYHHLYPVGGVNVDHMHPNPMHQMMPHPQVMGQQQLEMVGYPMEMEHSHDCGCQQGGMYPQHHWQSHIPSYRDVEQQQYDQKSMVREEHEQPSQPIQKYPPHFNNPENHSLPTPPTYPHFTESPNETDDSNNE